jgi:hypothetical protein
MEESTGDVSMIVGLKVIDDTEIEGDRGVLRPRSEPD